MTTFDDWITEMASDGLEFGADINEGAIKNMWVLSFAPDESPAMADLTQFIQDAVALRRSQVLEMNLAPATFYLWHDAQAGQLRFSVAQCVAESLPFRCEIVFAHSIEQIVRNYFEFEFDQMEAANTEDRESVDAGKFGLSVWACELA